MGGGGGPGLDDVGTGGGLIDGGCLEEGTDGAELVLADGLGKPGIGILGGDETLFWDDDGTGGLTPNTKTKQPHINYQVINHTTGYAHIKHIQT